MTEELQSLDQRLTPQRAGECELPLTDAVCSRLVALHGPMVKAACERILQDPGLAEDVAQEVFLLLVRRLPALPRQTLLGGWLYLTACQLARTHRRTHFRRWNRENRPETIEYLMNPAQDCAWRELETLIDDAMLTLSQRQRELVLFRYFHNNTQRAAANLVGCSESVASRELAAAIERLRKFCARQGVTVSGAALVTLLITHGAQASISTGAIAATLSSVSAQASASTLGGSFLLALMKTTTTGKIIIAAAAALLITSGTVYYLRPTSTTSTSLAQTTAGSEQTPASTEADRTEPAVEVAGASAAATPSETRRVVQRTTESSAARRSYDEAELKAARERQMRFFQRMSELALMTDPAKVQELLAKEYGIKLSAEEIGRLQKNGPKGFTFGLIQLWASKQPEEALAWAASTLGEPNRGGVDFHQLFLDAARRALPNLDRDTLATMLPEAPGRQSLLDLVDAGSDPASLAERVLSVTDPAERASQLESLAKGWDDKEAAAEWGRQNLSGAERISFYEQLSYELAHKNPEAALQVLTELEGTDAYASAFGRMMRGLVQLGGLGEQAADLIENANLNPAQRADLISELSRRWVRSDPDATVAWVNSLTAPEDFRAAIPLLVSQLDNDRVSRTVETYLDNHDPVMELALIEAAAPPGLMFDPEKSRLILDPLIAREPELQLSATEGNGSSREEILWSSVNQTARRQAEAGSPAAAMDWLARLPFASESDYAAAIGNVWTVWNLKSETEAAAWLRNSTLSASVKATLQAGTNP